MIVAKVGGSLYDDPRLGPALRAWVAEQPEPVLLVPGGGDFADAVRKLDRIHGLGEESAHWLAIRSMSLAGEFLERVTKYTTHTTPSPVAGASHPATTSPPHAGERSDRERSDDPGEGGQETRTCTILDAVTFFQEHDLTPHTWAVTSDSLAAAVAIHLHGSRLVLLKSIDIPPGTPWAVAAERGWVDAHFPELLNTAVVPAEVVNFRKWIENHFPNTSDRLS